MVPPLKRRRLLFWAPEDSADEEEGAKEMDRVVSHTFSHSILAIEANEKLVPVEDLTHQQHILERQVVGVSEAVAADTTVTVAIATAVTTVVGGVSASVAVGTSLTVDASLSTDTVLTTSSTFATPTPGSATSSTSAIGGAAPSVSIVPNSPSSTTTIAPSSNVVSTANSVAATTISSTSPITASTTTSSTAGSASTSNKSVTVAENILTGALNSTSTSTSTSASTSTGTSSTITGATSSTVPSTGFISSSALFSNSSLTYSSPTLTPTSTSDPNDGGVATSFVLTTIYSNGQPVSTYTTAVGAGAAGYGASATATPSTAVTSGDVVTPTPPPPGTIAGGVVGGAAGIAVLLLVAMLFLRWYRRRAQNTHQALLPESAGSYQDSPDVSRDGPGMAERAGLRPWAAAIPGMLRHQSPSHTNEFAAATISQERGFQRVSGRKLPSAWSPGMEGPRGPMPYRDYNQGAGASPYNSASNATEAVNPFLDTEGSTPEDEIVPSRRSPDQMVLVPGPQRRPTIHDPQRQPNVAGADTRIKHMSSAARTSGGPATLLSTESLLNQHHTGHFREDV